jgi:hypothetical protein
MTSLSACVIPVGPRFEDPPGQENLAPEIENTDPLQGGVVTVPSNTAKRITITVTDPNASDDLYIRWIAEYPPYTINSIILLNEPVSHAANGERLHSPQAIAISCQYPLARTITLHTLMALVSDRPFLQVPDSQEADAGTLLDLEKLLTTAQDGAKTTEAHWFVSLPCPE